MIQKFISSLSDKEKKYFYISAFFVMLALFDRFFLSPIMDRLNLIDEQIAQEKASILRDEKFLLYKDKIMEEASALKKYFTSDKNDPDIINAEFLSSIERLATEHRVNLVKSNPLPPKEEAGYYEYYANLDCTGDLKDIINFMYAVNTSDDLLKIVSFTFTPTRGANGKINATMTVSKLLVEQVPSNDISLP